MAIHPQPSGLAVAAVLAALLLATTRVAAAATPATRYALRGAQLEVLPSAQQHGRFQLRARVEPASYPPARADAGPLKLTASLTHKALPAQCPLPGSVFFDGFDAQ